MQCMAKKVQHRSSKMQEPLLQFDLDEWQREEDDANAWVFTPGADRVWDLDLLVATATASLLPLPIPEPSRNLRPYTVKPHH